MINGNRNKMIDCLVTNYREKLIALNNYAIAEEVFHIMKCVNCPCHNDDCDLFTCVKTTYDFIEENEVKE